MGEPTHLKSPWKHGVTTEFRLVISEVSRPSLHRLDEGSRQHKLVANLASLAVSHC